MDVIGSSILFGEHLIIPTKITSLLKERGVREDRLVIVGDITEADVDEIFETGSSRESIVDYIQKNACGKRP